MSELQSSIPGFFLLGVTVDFDGDDFSMSFLGVCGLSPHMGIFQWHSTEKVLDVLVYFSISASVITCAPQSLGSQKAICVPFCSCYTMGVSAMRAQATQPERQEPVKSFVFFVQMQLWITIVFLLCFLSRKLTSLC